MLRKKLKGKLCPLLKGDCVGSDCMWSVKVRGTNPNTGAEVDNEGCAMAWVPVLLIETTQQTRQAGAAIESLRNTERGIHDESVQTVVAGLRGMNTIVERLAQVVGSLDGAKLLESGG